VLPLVKRTQARHALDGLGGFPGILQGAHEQRHQDGDDNENDEQLDEREVRRDKFSVAVRPWVVGFQ